MSKGKKKKHLLPPDWRIPAELAGLHSSEDDPGIREYFLSCGAAMRFNPADKNLHRRREYLIERLDSYKEKFDQYSDIKSWEHQRWSKVAGLYQKCSSEILALLPWVYGKWNGEAIKSYFNGRSIFEKVENGKALFQVFEEELKVLVKNN